MFRKQLARKSALVPAALIFLSLALLGLDSPAQQPLNPQILIPGDVPELRPAPAPGPAMSSTGDLDRPIPLAASRDGGAKVVLVDAESTLKEQTSGDALDEKHEQVASQLRVAMLQEEAEKAAATEGEATAPKANESEVDLLKQIDVIIAQQKAATATLQDIRVASEELKLQLGKLADDRLDEPPPYSVMMLDELRDSIKSLKLRSESLQASILAARNAVEQGRRIVDEKKQALRQQRETSPNAELNLAELDVQLSEEILVLRRQELAVEEANEGVRVLQLAIDEKKVAIIGDRVTFEKETLDSYISELDTRESELKRKAETLQIDLNLSERRWLAARQEVDSTPSPGQELLERVDALKTNQQTIQLELSVVNQRLQRLPMVRTAWERRYLVATGQASHEERRKWLDETIKQTDELARERRGREVKINELRATLANVNAKIDALNGGNEEVKRWLETKQAALNKQTEVLTGSFLAIDSATRVLQRLQVQIEGERGRTFAEWAADAWSSAKRIWNYELVEVDDTFVTVGKVVSSVLFIFFGFFAARYISSLLGRRLPKLGVDEAGASVIETLSFYFLMVAFALAALRYANVPLTVFTFLGGAIAIGVGFGSQNILNNFISGLILMAERPIKVGDLILVDDVYGNVNKIGARSTQIRTGENLDIIVPNSKFLENNVTNLTRRDDRLRTSILVGVAYGSPLEDVVRLLEQAAEQANDVQERPKPMVWFNDFGDNSLIFQVHFWIKARTVTQMRKIETDVRLNIDRFFRENDIVIAFPQRDLHIQSPRPIELRLTSDGDLGSLRAAS